MLKKEFEISPTSGITTSPNIRPKRTKFTPYIHLRKIKYEATDDPKWPETCTKSTELLSLIGKRKTQNFTHPQVLDAKRICVDAVPELRRR